MYTGIAIDVFHRFAVHRSGKGAKYTKAKGASKIVYIELCENRATAMRRESQIKKLSKQKKLLLCATYS